MKSQLRNSFQIVVAAHGGGIAIKFSRKRRRRPPKSRSSHDGSFKQRATDSVSHEDVGSCDAYPRGWAVNWTLVTVAIRRCRSFPRGGDMGTYDNQFPWIQLGWLWYKNMKLLEAMSKNLRESWEWLTWARGQGEGASWALGADDGSSRRTHGPGGSSSSTQRSAERARVDSMVSVSRISRHRRHRRSAAP